MSSQKSRQPLSKISKLFGTDFVLENVWKCPKQHLEQQFISNVTLNHLEVGVTSGFDFTKRLKANRNLNMVYLDPDAKALKQAGKNTAHLKPRLFQGSLVHQWGFTNQKFSSINLNFVLHGLQGDFEDKVNALCMNARSCLADNGKVFGSAILRDRISTNPVSEYFFKRCNRAGIMNNEKDSFRKLERMLNYFFTNVHITMVGYVVMFEGKMKEGRRRGRPEMEPYNSRKNVVNFPNGKTKKKEVLARNRQRTA